MASAAKKEDTITARTQTTLLVALANRNVPPNGTRPTIEIVIVCNHCSSVTRLSDIKVDLVGEFWCFNCFRKLVLCQKMAFGVSETPDDDEIKRLLRPLHLPGVQNLCEPISTPRFLCIYDAPPQEE